MGKHKYIETPEKMWELFESYVDYVKNNPRTIEKALQSGKVAIEKYRVPLTMEGFENYVANQGLNQELSHYFSNAKNSYNAYLAICSRIRREIRQDQIEGGMVGQYNPSITQRLNGLTEKQETTHKGSIDGIQIEIVKPSESKD